MAWIELDINSVNLLSRGFHSPKAKQHLRLAIFGCAFLAWTQPGPRPHHSLFLIQLYASTPGERPSLQQMERFEIKFISWAVNHDVRINNFEVASPCRWLKSNQVVRLPTPVRQS